MRAIGRRILVRQDPPEKISTLLEIPDYLREESSSGVVVSAGEKTDVNVGDSVIFNKFDYEKIGEEGEELLVIQEQELKFIFKNKQ